MVNTLEGLGRPIDRTEDWFVYSVVNLFDSTTRDKWEERVTSSNDPPSFATLKDFMTKRRQQLEASTDESSSRSPPEKHNGQSMKHEPRSYQGQPVSELPQKPQAGSVPFDEELHVLQ